MLQLSICIWVGCTRDTDRQGWRISYPNGHTLLLRLNDLPHYVQSRMARLRTAVVAVGVQRLMLKTWRCMQDAALQLIG